MNPNKEPPRPAADYEQSQVVAYAEDPATQAASEDLKKSSLSDKMDPAERGSATCEASPMEENNTVEEPPRVHTPEAAMTEEADQEMRERLASPKKKRSREQDVDEDVQESNLASTVLAEDKLANVGVTNGHRTTESEPMKKRHRDVTENGNLTAELPSEKSVRLDGFGSVCPCSKLLIFLTDTSVWRLSQYICDISVWKP